MLHALIHPANRQDRDGRLDLLATLQTTFPKLKTLFADAAYQGPRFRQGVAALRGTLEVEIAKRPMQDQGVTVLPKHWLVERTLV